MATPGPVCRLLRRTFSHPDCHCRPRISTESMDVAVHSRAVTAGGEFHPAPKAHYMFILREFRHLSSPHPARCGRPGSPGAVRGRPLPPCFGKEMGWPFERRALNSPRGLPCAMSGRDVLAARQRNFPSIQTLEIPLPGRANEESLPRPRVHVVVRRYSRRRYLCVMPAPNSLSASSRLCCAQRSLRFETVFDPPRV